MEHEAPAEEQFDDWQIGRLRRPPERARGEDLVERLLRPHEAPDTPARLETLADAIVELGTRLDALELEQGRHTARLPQAVPADHTEPEVEPSARAEGEPGHTFLVPTPQGYELVEGESAAPSPGASVTIDGRRYTVEGRRRTPLPHDRRPCLVLAPAPADDAAANV